MRRLVCAFVVRKLPKTGFLASRPNIFLVYRLMVPWQDLRMELDFYAMIKLDMQIHTAPLGPRWDQRFKNYVYFQTMYQNKHHNYATILDGNKQVYFSWGKSSMDAGQIAESFGSKPFNLGLLNYSLIILLLRPSLIRCR